MTYKYYISYDEVNDEFFALVDVDRNNKSTRPIFTIDSTDDMVSFIKRGIMDHIDDIDGLAGYLEGLGLLKSDDCLLLCEELMY